MTENGKGSFGGREVVIVEAARTPIGRGHPEKGYYKDTHPSTLLARNLEALISRAGIDPMVSRRERRLMCDPEDETVLR